MKKLMVISLVMFLVSGVFVSSFAQTAAVKKTEAAVDIVKGTVVSVDTVKNEAVVKENKTGATKTIVVDPSIIPTLKAGTNVAESVKKIVKMAVTNKKQTINSSGSNF